MSSEGGGTSHICMELVALTRSDDLYNDDHESAKSTASHDLLITYPSGIVSPCHPFVSQHKEHSVTKSDVNWTMYSV